MKITEIQVNRFGVWHDVSFPLHTSGLNVVYGPNEAGKSTLMRFIRSVLYGYDSFELGCTPHSTRLSSSQAALDSTELVAGHTPHSVWDGSLGVLHQGQHCQVRRAWRQGTRGLVSISGLNLQTPAQQLLNGILADTDEKLFNSVFAVGLHELQELATLNDDEVAGYVYGLTLGPDGQRLLDVTGDISRSRDELLDENTESGELAELLARDEQLSRELQDVAGNRQRHADLCHRRHNLETEICDLKERQSGIRSQLRGHQFLERVWDPWNDVRQFEEELGTIPHVAEFPATGLARLDELDSQLAATGSERSQMVEHIRDLRAAAKELEQAPEFCRRVATLRSLVDQRDSIGAAVQSIEALDNETRTQRELLDLHLAEMGADWSPERLEMIDTSPAATHRGVQCARTYQTASAVRHRLGRRHDRLAKACQRQHAELSERLKSLGGTSLDDELQATRARLTQLESFGTLQLRESELELQLSAIRRNTARLENREALPNWVVLLLLFLLVAGGMIAALGFFTGLTLNGIAGASLVLVGLTGCGIGYGMKKHAEIETDEELEQLKEHARTVEIQLRETREALNSFDIDETTGTVPDSIHPSSFILHPSGKTPDDSNAERHAELIAATARRLFELEQLIGAGARIQMTRRHLSERRVKIREAQRRLGDARQQWCEFVVGIGLPETIKVDEAFAAWQRVVEARDAHARWKQAAVEADRQRCMLDGFRQRCANLAQQISLGRIEDSNLLALLDLFSKELHTREENRAQRRSLLREIGKCRRSLRVLNAKLAQTRREWSALLVKGGAADRDEFLERATHVTRRREVEECLALAQTELQAAASTEPALAIVEEDLLTFDAAQNSEHIEVLEREHEDLQSDLQQAYEQLGSVKQSIAEVEDDRRSTRLRCERSQVRHELKKTVERWLALNLAGRAVDTMRSRFERTCQPPTLAAAGEFLKQLTAGRYATIWTPLGKRHLCIDDDRGNAFRVEQLSNGTREQLFLAIRFAMVREFARKGVELPLVLDDILVNFDQERTEAAVDALLRFVEDGQQVLLFTCHLHLAHLFQSKGIEPTWLPGHTAAVEERLAG